MILVAGGAGYIGSHLVKMLVQKQPVVVVDNLTTGHREAVDSNAIFIKGDIGDEKVINSIFTKYPIKAVFHFAANSTVGESIENPMKYYENNVTATLTLLRVMLRHNVGNFIFSSTAATYGNPSKQIIDEVTDTKPINPYGQSKLIIERILTDYAKAYNLKYVILRYFNAAGAHETAEIGESHQPETHLIPIVLDHLKGTREKVFVFGSDYDTPDGTCIRDYIHVSDLANAHILALNYLLDKKFNKSVIFNLGNEQGYSVKEVIKTCEKVTGLKATVEVTERREGDPARLIASSKKIFEELGWKAEKNLEEIIESAWNWHKDPKF